MKIGDLVRVTTGCDSSALHNKTGVMMCRVPRYEPGKDPLVRVFVEGSPRLFDYNSLEVVSEISDFVKWGTAKEKKGQK